ncbi:MAG TPA: uridine diphosphate-N-acetylglucosamine-binding protein YvcK, partial [Candidatus Polarisedimenticolia bacterium]|nr:uridine diphosphate-N-acetylglucosamine-binding protein YvcK [Candidatus Polarisedimenticolia bacterium]
SGPGPAVLEHEERFPRAGSRAMSLPWLPRVAALGGGTGLPILLRGLRGLLFPPGTDGSSPADRDRLTAVVSVADDGGSSGRLREDCRIAPPGDLRNCLLALASADPELRALFGFRFDGTDGALAGHSLGNIILAALSRLQPGLAAAAEGAARLLDVQGRVLPCSEIPLVLEATFEDGTTATGESRIAAAGRPIRRIALQPAAPPALPEAVQAIRRADVVVLGPGSLYTSLLPVLLVPEIAEAVVSAQGRVVLVCNLLTEAGETDGFDASDFVLALRRHLPSLRIDDLLLHRGPLSGSALATALAGGSRPVEAEVEPLRFLGCRVHRDDLAAGGAPPRHDPFKLGRRVMALALERTQPGVTP